MRQTLDIGEGICPSQDQGLAQMTQNQKARVIQAIAETQKLLDREMSYLPVNRKADLIAFYEGHIASLTNRLNDAA